MKLLIGNLLVVLLSACLTHAWVPESRRSTSATSLQLATAEASDLYFKPERVIRDELPTLFVYDHCPFCVRVRVAMGIKNVKHNIYFMANDDVKTPTDLVGKKIAPIFVSLLVIQSSFVVLVPSFAHCVCYSRFLYQ
jgi:hypothetical protein